MENITVERLDRVLSKIKTTQAAWAIRECCICNTRLHYIFNREGGISFDGNCNCVNYVTAPIDSSKDEFIEIFNRQTPGIRKRMWDNFLHQIDVDELSLTFQEAMLAIYKEPNKVCAVRHKLDGAVVYYDDSIFMNTPVGFQMYFAKNKKVTGYKFSADDLLANDWYVLDLDFMKQL